MNHENNDNSHNQASFSDRNRRPLLPLNPNGSSVTPTTHSSSCSSSPVQDVNIPDTSVGHLNTRNQTENFSATPNAFLQNLIESTHENLNSSNMIVSPGSNGFNNGCRECTDESCYSCRQFPSMSSGYRGDWGMYHPLLVPQTTVSSAFLKPNCSVGNFKWEITHAMNEARYGIAIMREDLDAVQIATNILDQRAKQAATDTMLCIRGLINDLKERERNLMHKVERARLTKYSALRAREEGLREGISKLVNTLDRLHVIRNAQENSPADARFVKDFMMSEMFQMRQIQANLPSLEENWITFNAPDPGVNMAIANIGSLTILNPGHVGDRRGNRGRSICSPPVVIPPTLSLTVMASPPLAKAISSCDYPVICWLSKQTSSENLQPVRMIGTANIDIRDNICRPWGVACDKDGYLIIADRSNNRIQIYLWNGRFIRRFGTHGTGPGQFDRPAGVTVDAYQRIIVADKDNHRIQIFSMDGIFISTFGEKGALNGQFNYPWDVATNNKCQIVVSDTRNHRIQLFSPEGSFVSKYGFESNPSSWKYFDSPRGVSFCPDGSIIMTDFNNHRVIVVDSELLNARVICENATGTRLFSRPQGVIVDDEGNIIVADSRNHRIQIFDSLGRYKCKFGIYGKCYGELDRPSGIALLPDGRLAVVDFGNNRLIIL